MTNFLLYQESTIKAIFANPDNFDKVAQLVNSSDFTDERYLIIFETMKELSKNQIPISLLSVLEYNLNNNPEYRLDSTWVLSLEQEVYKVGLEAPADTWARLLKNESAKYHSNQLFARAKEQLENNDPLSVLSETKVELDKIATNATLMTERSAEEVVDDYWEFMDTRLDFKKNVIPSPYPSIDKYTVGWLPGQLITIGARTSVGKSVVATQSAITSCVSGKSTALFSLEMSEFDVMDRMISAMSQVELGAIKTRPLSKDETKRMKEATDRYKKFNMYIDDTASVTADYIYQKSKKLAQRPEGLDFVIVDYLQLIKSDGKGNREQAVAALSRAMKLLARELNIPVMILAQVNREKKDDEPNALPKIDDIRESGAIANDSDIILLIHRDIGTDQIDPKATFIIGKNRNGQPGKKLYFRCKLECAMFLDIQEDSAYDRVDTVPEKEVEDMLDDSVPSKINTHATKKVVLPQEEVEFTGGTSFDDDVFWEGEGDF